MKPCPICDGPGVNHVRVGEHWLLRCGRCRFVYAAATDQEIEEVNFRYEESAECHYSEIQTGVDYFWFDRITARLTRGRPGLKVLDIGCGNGVLLRQFQKRGCTCFGSDPSPWARACAERYGYTLFDRIENMEIEPGAFDLVTSTSALEHIARPLEHVRRVLEILKPGGVAYFTVPNYGSLPIRLRLVKGRLVSPPGHCNYFTAGTLRNLFRRATPAGPPADVRVASYGIPEIHGVYQLFSKRKAEKPAQTASGNASQRLWVKKTLVGIYYWSGRPFGLGDKLEATIRKSAVDGGNPAPRNPRG
ncbi:MAG TPA: class I SAM-dependent methyltransferase [Sedimentisphaerales bacterium]|jgi:SAM-dependent methyltransferase|nr:class I SAM-dependent methyltransferase [Sedimentisphaerales bacterium]HNU29756.1 class I SAM-dependent methyltransferase [Sedimentisphaerales bacterium]